MIEFIAFILPAVLGTAFSMSLQKSKAKESSLQTIISSLGLFSWFALSNNLVLFLLLQYGFGHVSTPVGSTLFNVTFTWKFLLIAIFLAFINALVTHEITKNVSIKSNIK